jgi:DNA-binding transcriptional regulator WhiA
MTARTIRATGSMARNISALSADAKDALTRNLPKNPHCRATLRAGLAYFGSVATPQGWAFRTRRPAIARLFRTLLDDRNTGPVRRLPEPRLFRSTTYEIDINDGLAAPPPKPRARCDRRMELRAAFLACGSLADPQHGYHLEFVCSDPERAARIEWLLGTDTIAGKRALRKGRTVIYLKGLDAIVAVLSAIGAYGAVLHLEDVRAMKETKNRIHRIVNTETANVVRAAGAGAAQREAIAFLADAYGLRNLSPVLRESAQLRLAHPDETLAELGRRCNPPVGKATLNGRIAALMRLVARLRGNEPPPASARERTKPGRTLEDTAAAHG